MAKALLPAVCLALVACSPPALAPQDRGFASPTLPDPLPKVATTPLLAGWVSDRVVRYRDGLTPEAGETTFSALRMQLEVMSLDAALEAAQRREVELVIAASEPPSGWFATPVGVEAIAVVVHPRNPVTNLNLETLRELFTGLIDDWEIILPDSMPAQPVVPLPGDESRTLLEQQILINRRVALTSLIGPSPRATVSMVSERQGAIGLLPLHAVTDKVKTIRVAGVEPSQASIAESTYPLVLRLIAFAPQEPGGNVRDWLVWLQEMRLSSSQ